MKTKILYRLAIATTLAGIVFVACSKSGSSAAATGTSVSDLQVQSSDQTSVSNETDAVEDDANTAMASQVAVSGASAQTTGHGVGRTVESVQSVNTELICDAAITVDSVDNPRTITLTYNGASCSPTRTRTGVVVISIPAGTKWRDTGAVITVNFQNLIINSLVTGKSMTINGTHTYTNVSGGSLVELYLGTAQSITHTITSTNMLITFDSGGTRTWSVARQRVWTYANTNVTITTTGLHTDGNTTGIAEWGLTRFGNSFETAIAANNPLVIQSGCSWRLTSGQVAVIRPDISTTITFGLDSAGIATSCPGLTGTYYFQAVWQIAGKSYSYILPY